MQSRYSEKIKSLSDALVEAQKPIRILDAIKWDTAIESDFFAKKALELPKVNADTYRDTPLGFDPQTKINELRSINAKIKLDLGEKDELGLLLQDICQDYVGACEMLQARGTRDFYTNSRKLYGSPQDSFTDGTRSILDQSRLLYDILSSLDGHELGRDYPKSIAADDAVKELNRRFAGSFLQGKIEVIISDGIVADAAAGSSEIKLKQGAYFSKKDIDIFEVHEGWVHVATTLNGRQQSVATFLSKGPPRCAGTQEGLAILMEILTFSSYPLRARIINDRVLGIAKAESGADFIELFKFYLAENYSEAEAFRNSMRVFRGGDVRGGVPFTKDISYCRGFVENYNFIRTAIRRGKTEMLPFLFVGKVKVDDLPLIYQMHLEGIIDAPELLPQHFADLNGLAVWMSFSNFLNSIDLQKVQSRYDDLFKRYG